MSVPEESSHQDCLVSVLRVKDARNFSALENLDLSSLQCKFRVQYVQSLVHRGIIECQGMWVVTSEVDSSSFLLSHAPTQSPCGSEFQGKSHLFVDSLLFEICS